MYHYIACSFQQLLHSAIKFRLVLYASILLSIKYYHVFFSTIVCLCIRI